MSTEYYNSQWQMPNEVNKSKQANYSLDLSVAKFIDCGTSVYDKIRTSSGNSVAGWFKINTLTSGDILLFNFRLPFSGSSIQRDYAFYWSTNATSNIIIYVDNSAKITYSNFSPVAGAWYHACVSVEYGTDTTKQILYINGQSVATASSAITSLPNQTSNLYINQWYNSTWTAMQGNFSNICVFDYALSPSQVTTLYGTGSAIGDPMSLSSAPKAYYKLSDSIWNGSNYITPNSAVKDYVFDFSGSNDRVYGPTNYFESKTATTISFWVNPDALSGVQYLFSENGQPYIRLNGSNLQTTLNIGGTSPNFQSFASGMTVGKWHLVVFKWESGSKYQVYVNNELKGESTSTITGSFPADSTGQIELGNSISNEDLQGKMSNFKVWDVALTTSELTTLYNYGSPIKTLANIPQSSNLKAWYKLDASEVYNSLTTEWSIDNNQNPSAYSNYLQFPSSGQAFLRLGTAGVNIGQQNTISIWVNFNGTTGDDHLISTYAGNWMINPNVSSGYLCYAATDGTGGNTSYECVSGLTYPTGWFLLTVVRNNTNFSVYFNDQLQGSGSESGFTSDTVVGMISSTVPGRWTHAVSNLTLFNTSLPLTGSNSITTLYNNGTPLSSMSGFSSLQGWWKLIGGGSYGSSGLRMPDYSSNSNTTESTLTLTPSSIETGFVNKLTGGSSGMSRSNLVQSDLSRVFNDNALSLSGGTARYNVGAMAYTFKPSGSNFTFSVWLRNTSTARGGIFSKGSTNFNATDFGVIIEGDPGGSAVTGDPANDGKIVFIIGGNSASTRLVTNTVLTSGQWYNFVATYTSGDLKLYLNGSLDNSTTSITKSSFTAGGGSINSCITNGWNFSGQTSNFAFFDTVLSATEVREIWNNGLPGDLKSHSKVSNLTNWLKGAKGTDRSHTMDYVSPYSTEGSYSLGLAASGFTDFQGTSSGFNEPAESTNITNDAPYSDKNAISYNMASMDNEPQIYSSVVSGRSTDTPQAT